jgi:8-oxo-dGTP diphosphatase
MKVGEDYIGITTPFYCNDGKGNFLLHKRSKNCRDEQGKWDPGGGRLEFGLTPEENVLKEIREEYGCKGKIQKGIPPHTILRINNGKGTHWIAFPFFIKVKKSKVKINEPDKIDELGWFRLNKLPEPLHSGFNWTFKHYKKYFKSFVG